MIWFLIIALVVVLGVTVMMALPLPSMIRNDEDRTRNTKDKRGDGGGPYLFAGDSGGDSGGDGGGGGGGD
jgi:hypothetical protein